MKNLIIITITLLSVHLLKAQFECFTPPNNSVGGKEHSENYVYDPNGPVKTIRVNFHYLLKDDGTGNFTETCDNYTNLPYNGYLFAEDLITWCNNSWNENALLRHMPILPVPALPKKIQLQLCGVYFHRNTSHYEQNWCASDNPPAIYYENAEEVVNIYMTKNPPTGGCAGGTKVGNTFYNAVIIGTAYDNYKLSIDINSTWRRFHYARILVNHEVGHVFGIHHVIQDCCKTVPRRCDNNGISDTPTHDDLIKMGFTHNEICDYNHPRGSNNLMDYNAGMVALSPGQISKFHEYVDGSNKYYRNCKYKTQSLNITSFSVSKAYIAKSVTIPSVSNIVVGNNSALYINAEEFTVNGEFEVQLGSVLNVDIVPACD